MYDLLSNLGLELPDAVTTFEPRVVTGTLTTVGTDAALVKFNSENGPATGVLPVTEAIRGRGWAPGATHVLLQCEPALPRTRPTLSAVRPGFIEALLTGISPEVRDGRVRVMG